MTKLQLTSRPLQATAVSLRLQPAFFDMETGRIYLSRYTDGRPAPVHILDGLPAEVAQRTDINLVSGFVLEGRFLTRDQALKHKLAVAA